jgi:hypothetical protein
MLLVPLTSICDDAALLARYIALEEAYFQKNLELSKLGKKIAKTDKLLSSYQSELNSQLCFLVDKKIKEYTEQNSNNVVSKEEIARIASAIECEMHDFISMVCLSFEDNKDIEGVLSQELLQQDNNGKIEGFESLKFFALRITFERSLIKLLIKKYEGYLKEMADLYTEMKHLVIKAGDSL